ncbi:MAG TPA: orotate phosphoribosyltransferase [Thermoanaerobaculia bacterium]|nr:orotate phosphoribosyltransferase [Thermoanaerobaculia bacterium]
MSLDVRRLLEQTGALLSGHFRLSSGLHSGSYVQCALLLEHPRNAKAIGEALAGKARALNPAKIVAPALGGVIIGYTVAEALGVPMVFTERKEGQMTLRRGFRLNEGERVVIVEDVVTTGKSTRETADVIAQHGGSVVGFASILNRSGRPNPFDLPYEFLLALDFETYDESACPSCAAGVTLDAPGSRFSGKA